MKSAKTVAKAFLCLSRPEVGDAVTNLKLQKLLYYAQGFHVAIYGKPLFKEDIVAWEHGPVVKEVYNDYKSFGANTIAPTTCPTGITKAEQELIGNIWEVYGQFSAWKLRDMTHNEAPWINTSRNKEISNTKLKSYFKNLISD